MVGFHGVILAVGIAVLSPFCDDTKSSDVKVLSKTAVTTPFYGEIVKISSDSVTVKMQELIPSGSGKKAKMKNETKEHTFPIEEKAKVKFTKATKEALPKIDEIAVGEKVTLHMTTVKTKDADNKIDSHLAVTGIDLTPKPPKKDDKTTGNDK